jgi:malonyl-CoA O-methyltransferase
MLSQQNKRAVKRCFSRAANTYDQAASLQQQVAQRLMLQLPMPYQHPTFILDIGAGTGYCSRALAKCYPAAEVLGIDFAEGMNQVATRHALTNEKHICADFDHLPLANSCADVVVSSLALQWSQNIAVSFKELARVLKPHGYLNFATLIEGSLAELKIASIQNGCLSKTNPLLSLSAIQNLLASQLTVLSCHTETKILTFPDVSSVLRSLKAVGANHLYQPVGRGLQGKHSLQKLAEAYQPFAIQGALPLRYEIAYFSAIK